MMIASRRRTTVLVGAAQTIAWASSYYLPAILAVPMAQSVGVSSAAVFAAFSCALLVSAFAGPVSGRLVDRFGGRPVLMASSALFAASLLLLASADQAITLWIAWLLMGLAMAGGLYDTAFATLVRLYGTEARTSITGVTLMAGFASTIGWPLTAWLETTVGWRGACAVWAAAHVFAAMLFYAPLPRVLVLDVQPQGHAVEAGVFTRQDLRPAVLLATVFAATWFVSTAMAAHLPQVLVSAGVGLGAAITIAALVGPAQVAGRLGEFAFLRSTHPLVAARLAATAHPIGAALLLTLGPAASPAFAVLHGLGNGILTIANGALPLAIFGAAGYGRRQGWLMMPARVVQAAAPFLFGLGFAAWGLQSLWISMGGGIVALGALLVLRAARRPTP